MLVIRLTRKGKKNQPFFRLVVTDKRTSAKGGRAVEVLGYVDPLTKRKNIEEERVQYWISKGAKPSETVHNLLVSEKIIEGKKMHVSKLSTKKKTEITKAKADQEAKVAADSKAKEAASQSESSLAPEGAGSQTAEPVPAEAPKEEPKEKPAE